MIKIYLKAGKEEPVKRFHPWIFSGAIAKIDGTPEDGDVVTIYSHRKEFLGIGHYQNGSITVRICSFIDRQIDLNFWIEKLQNAKDFRTKLGLFDNKKTDCFRYIHGEGDGLPSLIIDIYKDTAVVQCHSIGMHKERQQIANALMVVLRGRIKAVYDKSHETLPEQYAQNAHNQYLIGESEPTVVSENGHQFKIDWVTGQKTGFFLDQRDNRDLLARYAKGKKVLNAFCYSGGFSVYALKAGASEVDSVDVSARAIELTEINVALNGDFKDKHTAYAKDVMHFLKENEKAYDVMIIDPPAYAKSMSKRHNAVQGYKRLNALAMSQAAKGSIIFTFSCSQVVDRELFYNTIVAAAIESKRHVRVMHQLTQPADHPVSLFHSEGSYLKGLVLFVE